MGVAAKIAKVMDEVGRIPKNGRNPHFGYDYVTESDLMDYIRPLMARVGLVIVPAQNERVEREVETRGGMTIVAAIHHTFLVVDTEDDSSVEVQVWGEGQDSGDKASYKAFTGAMKYCLMKLFLVSTGDDPERDTHESLPAGRPAPEPEPVNYVTEVQGVEPVDALLDEPIRFGKHKGQTWREVLEADRQYAVWAVKNAKKMGRDLRATLAAELADPVGSPSEPESEAVAETEQGDEGPGGTTTGPPANKGQVKALERLFGAVFEAMPAVNRTQIEAVLASDRPGELEVTEWAEYCAALKDDLEGDSK